jgi:hypothetical protein
MKNLSIWTSVGFVQMSIHTVCKSIKKEHRFKLHNYVDKKGRRRLWEGRERC